MSEKFRRAKRKGIINIIEQEIESLENHVLKSTNMKQDDKTNFTMYVKGKIAILYQIGLITENKLIKYYNIIDNIVERRMNNE